MQANDLKVINYKMMNKLFSIKDNVVVITGGTGVLGRTIAEFLNLLPSISGDRNAFSFEKQK